MVKLICRSYGTAIVFFSFIVGICIYSFFVKAQSFSETENRNLQQKPEFSLSSFMEGAYQTDMAKFQSDQYYKRESFVQMKTNIERKLGKVIFQDVFVGRKQILFQKSVLVDTGKLKELSTAFNAFAKNYENLNISVMLVPNKATIWEGSLPHTIKNQNQQERMRTFQSMLSEKISWIDVTKPLLDNKDKYLYYRSDHHWTALGASLGFEAYKQQRLKNIPALPYTLEPINRSFFGTLATKSANYQGRGDVVSIPVMKDQDYIVDYVKEQKKATSIYVREKATSKNPYDVFLGGNHPLVQIRSVATNKVNLLLLKDSFANSFLPFLLPYYRSITIVDPRYYYDDIHTLIKDQKIQEILFLYNANTLFSDTSLQGVLMNK